MARGEHVPDTDAVLQHAFAPRIVIERVQFRLTQNRPKSRQNWVPFCSV